MELVCLVCLIIVVKSRCIRVSTSECGTYAYKAGWRPTFMVGSQCGSLMQYEGGRYAVRMKSPAG